MQVVRRLVGNQPQTMADLIEATGLIVEVQVTDSYAVVLEGLCNRTIHMGTLDAFGYLAASQQGLLALSFSDSELDFIDWLKDYTGAEVRRDIGRLAEAAEQVRQYLAGDRLQFVLPLDLRFLTDFQRRVLTSVANVPAGQVTTYGDLARRIQRPRGARAVGQALGSNPIPIVLPCHRVLASDGGLVGYSGRGGIKTKRFLLTLEGVDLDAGQLPLF